MSSSSWERVKEEIGNRTLCLGPYFAQQLLDNPRHLLFTLSRYKFATKLLPQGSPVKVLELGCNEGVGTLMLAEAGHQIIAVDFDEDAIRYAKESFDKPNISFIQSDFLAAKFGEFDAVISLDVIEHIPNSDEDSFFETICQNLSDTGQCLIGTPNITASQYASPRSEVGHINLFTADRLASLMGKYFEQVFMFGMNDEVVHTGFFPMCHYLFALGTGKRTQYGD